MNSPSPESVDWQALEEELDTGLDGINFDLRLHDLDTCHTKLPDGTLVPQSWLPNFAARLVADTIKSGHARSAAEVEQLFRGRGSFVYLAAKPLATGVTSGSFKAAGSPSAYTYLVQDRNTMPEYTLGFLMHGDTETVPAFPDGISYEENLARLEKTGVWIDTIVRD